MMSNLTSEAIKSRDRASCAPYNFVPPPASVRWLGDKEAPTAENLPADRYHPFPQFLSGQIQIEMVAKTDFYIRGMWSLEKFLTPKSRNGIAEERAVKDQSEPFQVEQKLRLPGSSLRGMVRSLVEILGSCPLDPINDRQMFFRAVGASNRPGAQSFEPNAAAYKERISPGAGTALDPAFPVAQAGYLYADGDDWEIRPAAEGPFGSSWYRVPVTGMADFAPPERIVFEPVAPETATYLHSRIFYRFGIVRNWHPAGSFPTLGTGLYRGTLIRSGKIPPKYLQWIIHEEKPAVSCRPGEVVKVPLPDVGDYRNDRNLRIPLYSQYDNKSQGAPCFYVTWKDGLGEDHVSFGHTPYFRLPYRTTPQMANPVQRQPGEARWDLAQAIFGRITDGRQLGAAGRVFFEDAFLASAPNRLVDDERSIVLAEPKPTTYQHYLIQNKTSQVSDIIHWDGTYNGDPGRKAILRGFKRYWHRKGAPLPSAAQNQQNVATRVRLAKEGCVFKAKIRFDNLRWFELGAMLAALELPPGCMHQLGMGKPVGLGSFAIRVTAVRLCRRELRYSSLFRKEKEMDLWNTGLSSSGEGPRTEIKRVFARWALKKPADDRSEPLEELWNTPRLQELRALLTFENLPVNWLERTRPLQIQPQNEYKWPGKCRSLPPASQVLTKGEGSVP